MKDLILKKMQLFMTKHLLFIAIVGLILPCNGQKRVSETNEASAKAYLDSLRIDTNTPGISAAIAIKGKTVWEYGSGFSDVAQNRKASPNTVYRIASVSKLITTAAVSIMVENNQLSFSDNLNPFFAALDEKITVRQLLSHTSGVRHYNYNEKVENYPHYDDVVRATEVFINDPLEFSPGEKYQYSSYGIDLVGALVEKKSQQSFEQYVQTKVLHPLKMKNTFLRKPEGINNLSKFYENDQTLIPDIDLSYNIPGGGMYSTVQDLVKFGNAFIADSYLSNKVKEQLFSKAKLNNGEEVQYGLGWIIQKLDDGSEAYYHDGHMDGTHSILAIFPKYNASISIISNRGSHWGINEALQLLCKVNGIEKCPNVIAEETQNREFIMKTFQNLSLSFQNFQNAISNKDKSNLETLISNSFQSNYWPNKEAFIDFLIAAGDPYEVFDVDLSIKGLKNGDKAYVKTIRFLEQQNRSWFLKYILKDGQWSLTSIDVYD